VEIRTFETIPTPSIRATIQKVGPASCILSEIWNKYHTTSAFVGDLLGKSIKRMFGIKIEMVQGFELQYLERLLVIFELFEKMPREQKVHFRRFHFTPRAFQKSMNLGA
jgi:hypothetical protein